MKSFSWRFRETPKQNVPERYVKHWTPEKPFELNKDCVCIEHKQDVPFKILQLTDIHFDDHNDRKEETLALLRDVIGRACPHLIAVTGDWVSTSAAGDRKEKTETIFGLIESFGIPWTAVFGNHDDEGELSKYDYADLFKNYPHCLFDAGYSDLKGVGNHIVTVMRGEMPLFALLFLDSHGDLGYMKYDFIGKSQIDWVRWAIEGLNAVYAQHEGASTAIPSLLFQHIALHEYKPAYKQAKKNGTLFGRNLEGIFPPYKNSGLFSALRALNSTKGVFVGHDHDNNSACLYQGVLLAFGVQSGWCKEYARKSPKGGLLAEFSQDGTLRVSHLYHSMDP